MLSSQNTGILDSLLSLLVPFLKNEEKRCLCGIADFFSFHFCSGQGLQTVGRTVFFCLVRIKPKCLDSEEILSKHSFPVWSLASISNQVPNKWSLCD